MSCNNDEELWRYALEENTEISLSKCILNEGCENGGFPFGFYDGTTPVKDCGDLVVNCTNPYNKIKEGLMGESSLQVKRRRTLQFEPEILDAPVCNEVMQDGQVIDGAVSELPQWISGFTENSFESLDLSAEEWVAGFLNDNEMNSSSEKIHTSGASGSPVCQVTGLDNTPSPSEANVVQDQFVGHHQNVIFKGRKSFMSASSKSSACVVYPFDVIKPCDIRGDITLKDINQKMRAPPPPKPRVTEDLSVRYPKSAFSGKPVVGKTKLCTEGGKGSITIMRTMG